MHILNDKEIAFLKNVLNESGINMQELILRAVLNKTVILLCGPTCCGKTAAAINLALLLDTDIISVDSMQAYKKMDIGTDKINTQQYGIKQYMTDVFEPHHCATAVEFREMCRNIIDKEFFLRKKIPVLAGGSGLYIRAVTDNLEFAAEKNDLKKPDGSNKDSIVRENWQIDIGGTVEYEELKKVDPVYAGKISRNDSRRISRALDVFKRTGTPFSEFQENWGKRESIYNTIFIGLNREKKELHECIENRIVHMFENGLVKEVQDLVHAGFGHYNSLNQAVGYKEVISYLKGESSLEECRKKIVRNTKRLAKKQFTWFKADERINWIRAGNYDNIIDLSSDIMKIIWKDLRNE